MSLLVWLPLNGALNNQGLSDVNVINNGCFVNTLGKIGKCYLFSNSYLRIDKKLINTAEYSISFWMYPTDVSSNHCIFSTRNVNSGAVSVYLLPAGIRFDTSTSSNWQTGFKPSANTWYHITLVQDATKKYLYVNGVLTTSSAGTTTLSQVSSVCTIGCEHIDGSSTSIGTYFAGRLNDFRIYDHALSDKEVKEISKALVAHYPLNNQGKSNPNLLRYSKVTDTNKTILTSYAGSLWNNLTIANKDGYDGYYYPSSQSSTWFWSGNNWCTGLKANQRYTYTAWIYITAQQNFNFTSLGHFQVYNVNSSAADKSHEDVAAERLYEPSVIPANKWTKIRISFTTNNLANSFFIIYPRYSIGANVTELYFRNCKLEEGGTPTPWCPHADDIEGNGGAENLFKGTAMTPLERASSGFVGSSDADYTKCFRYYNGSASNHSFQGNTDYITLSSGSNIGISFLRKASDINLDYNSYYTISCEAKCTTSNMHLDIGLSYMNTSNTWVWRGGTNPQNFTATNVWQKFTLTFKPDADTLYIDYCFTVNGTGTLAIRKCKMEKGSVATPWVPNPADVSWKEINPEVDTLFDTSGYNHNMSKFGTGKISYITGKNPRYQVCTHFDGTSCWLGNEYSDAIMPTDAITINCWVEWLGSSFNPISCTEGGGWNFESNGTYIQFPAYIYGVGYAKAISDKTANYFADGKLHMLTGTLDCKTRTIKIYIDGVLNNTATYSSGDRIGYANNKFVIGGEAGGSGSSAGVAAMSTDNISDVRIYATALSADDIKELYNISGSIDNHGNSYAYEYNEEV